MRKIKNRNKNGRPVLEASEKKGYNVTFKMSTSDFYSLKAKARSAGVTRSEFIRMCIRSSIVKQRLTKELMSNIRKLCGMANNVNQIAHRANEVGYSDVHYQSVELRKKLENVITRIEK